MLDGGRENRVEKSTLRTFLDLGNYLISMGDL